MTSTVVLLGAGASQEAGIPLTTEMAQRMLEMLREQGSNRGPEVSKYDSAADILCYVVGGIVFGEATRGEDPFEVMDRINIEDAFLVIESLVNPQSSELSPFVAGWHRGIASLERSFTIGQPEMIRKKELELVAEGQGDAFRRARTVLLEALVELTQVEKPNKISYLVPLVEWADSTENLIATLNYDNTLDLAAETRKIRINDGIPQWNGEGRIELQQGMGVRLARLHGSTGWQDSAGGSHRIEQEPGPNPAVVFGAGNKVKARGPFLDLLEVFRRELRAAQSLVVCGYSFRDDHINAILNHWVTTEPRGDAQIIVANGQDGCPRDLEGPIKTVVTDSVLKASQVFKKLSAGDPLSL